MNRDGPRTGPIKGTGRFGQPRRNEAEAKLRNELSNPGPERVWYIADAFRLAHTVDPEAERVYRPG
mgnify:CR=1 FL=1